MIIFHLDANINRENMRKNNIRERERERRNIAPNIFLRYYIINCFSFGCILSYFEYFPNFYQTYYLQKDFIEVCKSLAIDNNFVWIKIIM